MVMFHRDVHVYQRVMIPRTFISVTVSTVGGSFISIFTALCWVEAVNHKGRLWVFLLLVWRKGFSHIQFHGALLKYFLATYVGRISTAPRSVTPRRKDRAISSMSSWTTVSWDDFCTPTCSCSWGCSDIQPWQFHPKVGRHTEIYISIHHKRGSIFTGNLPSIMYYSKYHILVLYVYYIYIYIHR